MLSYRIWSELSSFFSFVNQSNLDFNFNYGIMKTEKPMEKNPFMLKQKLKSFIQFITNPRLLLCFGIAWMITNGWSYIMFGVGTYYQIGWMIAVAGAYLAFLWVPFSFEKLVTFAIAILLMQWWFPKDNKTLGVLNRLRQKVIDLIHKKKNKSQQNNNDINHDFGMNKK